MAGMGTVEAHDGHELLFRSHMFLAWLRRSMSSGSSVLLQVKRFSRRAWDNAVARRGAVPAGTGRMGPGLVAGRVGDGVRMS